MRRALALFWSSIALACSSEPSASSSPTPPPAIVAETEPSPVPDPSELDYFYGVVGRTGVEHCVDGNSTWIDIQPTLGWTPVSGPGLDQLEDLLGVPVLARGRPVPAPERPPLPAATEMCPQLQMRSDWVNTPQGMRARRTEPLEIEHFEISSVSRIEELTVRVDGEQFIVEFANQLPFALTGVRLEVHYEGCYGKPGTASLSSEPTTLAPGETLRHEFPRIHMLDRPGSTNPRRWAREHAAADLVLAIDGGGDTAEAKVWADLTFSLSTLGHAFECP